MGTLDNMASNLIVEMYNQARRENPRTAHQRTKIALFDTMRTLGYYSPVEEAYDNILQTYKIAKDEALKTSLSKKLTILKDAITIAQQLIEIQER